MIQGCHASPKKMDLWTPKFYITDSKNQEIKGGGERIKCSNEKFERFICLDESELYELYKQCQNK